MDRRAHHGEVGKRPLAQLLVAKALAMTQNIILGTGEGECDGTIKTLHSLSETRYHVHILWQITIYHIKEGNGISSS